MMTIDIDKIAESKAKELGIDKSSAKFAVRCIRGLLQEVLEDSKFDYNEDYSEEEFKKRFGHLNFSIPLIGNLKLNYKTYKGYKKYAKSNENKTNV